MQQNEFDRFAEDYRSLHARSVRISGEDPEYFHRYKVRDAATLIRDELPVPSILDFGTGVGNSLPFLRQYFPSCRVVGTAVSRRSLDLASSRFAALAELRHFDGDRLPCADGEFGMAFAACVFHHIEHAEHPAMLAELRRVLAPGGWLILYEHNPWNPLTVRAVRNCPFDENARLIPAPRMRQRVLTAGFTSVRLYFRVFFPAQLAWLRWLEHHLAWLPLGAQYCLACRR